MTTEIFSGTPEALKARVDALVAGGATDVGVIETSEKTTYLIAYPYGASGGGGGGGTDQLVKVSVDDTNARFLELKLVAGANISLNTLNPGADETLEISATGGTNTDELAKVSANDTTANYLEDKIVAGTGISVATLNDGSNETFQVSSTVVNTDEIVKVSANDTTASYLESKIVAGANVTITTLNDGANETLQIEASGGGGGDELVKISSADTTAGFLESKLLAGEGIGLVKANVGANETLTIQRSSPDVETDLRWFWYGNSNLNGISPLNFGQSNSGSGTGVTVEVVTIEDDIARGKVNGGIGANSFAAIFAGLPLNGQMLFDTVERIYTFHVRIERLGTGASDKIIHHLGGFTNSRTAADPTRWMGVVYESNVSPNFLLRTTGPGSASTTTITDVPVVVDQRYKLSIRYFNDAGTRTVELYIDDVLKATNTTNLPATTEPLGFLHKAKSLDATAGESAFSLVRYARYQVVY